MHTFKKNIIIFSTALLIIIIAILIVFVFFYNSPQIKAYSKMGDDLREKLREMKDGEKVSIIVLLSQKPEDLKQFEEKGIELKRVYNNISGFEIELSKNQIKDLASLELVENLDINKPIGAFESCPSPYTGPNYSCQIVFEELKAHGCNAKKKNILVYKNGMYLTKIMTNEYSNVSCASEALKLTSCGDCKLYDCSKNEAKCYFYRMPSPTPICMMEIYQKINIFGGEYYVGIPAPPARQGEGPQRAWNLGLRMDPGGKLLPCGEGEEGKKITGLGELEEGKEGGIVLETGGLTGLGVKVAVIDTGIDYNHLGLKGKVIGQIDFINDDNDAMDDNGHGTFVAGIIASDDSNYPGVSPDISLLVAKVLDSHGQGTYGDLIDAIDWAVSEGADIINLSLGGDETYTKSCDKDLLSRVVNQVVNNYDISVVTSSGNSGINGMSPPACSSGAISVGAIDRSGYVSWWSSKGDEMDILGPGVKIISLFPNNKIAQGDGTSFAAPYISGIIALIKELKPKSRVSDIKKAIYDTADPASGYVKCTWFSKDGVCQSPRTIKLDENNYKDYPSYTGAGIINFKKALSNIDPTLPLPESPNNPLVPGIGVGGRDGGGAVQPPPQQPVPPKGYICCYFSTDDSLAKGICRNADTEQNCNDLYYGVAGCSSENCPVGLFDYYSVPEESFCSANICRQEGACEFLDENSKHQCVDGTTPKRCIENFASKITFHYPGKTCKELLKCGNGVIDPGEQCDDGRGNNSDTKPNACRRDCRKSYCGDKVVDAINNETCDDGNYKFGDGCSIKCTRENECGNGIIDYPVETCDEGVNNSDTKPNTCRTSCKIPYCGDEVVDNYFGEKCDLGRVNSNSSNSFCRSDCRVRSCGDKILDSLFEQCDDGNIISGDGCSSGCKKEAGCTNECSSVGVTQCSGLNVVSNCGNYDSDSCLEWGNAVNCPNNSSCVNGSCVFNESGACARFDGTCIDNWPTGYCAEGDHYPGIKCVDLGYGACHYWACIGLTAGACDLRRQYYEQCGSILKRACDRDPYAKYYPGESCQDQPWLNE